MTNPRPPKLIQGPGRGDWYLATNHTREDLVKCLEAASEQFAEDPQVALLHTVLSIRYYLACQGVPEEHLKIFDKLGSGLGDLGNGLRPKIFESKSTVSGTHTLSSEYASAMATASAAVTLAGRGRLTEYTRKAANHLGVPYKQLANFRKSLMARRIRSPTANFCYDLHVKMHFKEEPEIRLKIAEALLRQLGPIRKRSVEIV